MKQILHITNDDVSSTVDTRHDIVVKHDGAAPTNLVRKTRNGEQPIDPKKLVELIFQADTIIVW